MTRPSSRSTARTVPSGSSTATDSHRPSRTQDAPSRGDSVRRRTRARSSSRKRAQSARNSSDTNSPGGSVLRHRRRLSSLARVQTLLPTSLWKLWKLACGTAVAPTGPHLARWRTLRRAASGGNDSNGEASSDPRKERKVLRRKSIVCVLAAPFEVGSRGRRRVLRDGPARSTLRGRTAGRASREARTCLVKSATACVDPLIRRRYARHSVGVRTTK